MRITAIDAHTAGQSLRLITGGAPAIPGRTMMARRAWLGRHADHIRRAVMLEPRGHGGMSGALLTEPVLPGSHAGLLFMDTAGFGFMSGHAVIAVTTIALERRLIVPGGDGRTIVFDTPAGTVRATATPRAERTNPAGEAGQDDLGGPRIERVTFANVPSYVVEGGVEVALATRRLRADLAFGGEFYAIVDGEAAGLPIDVAHLPELRRAADAIKAALARSTDLTHPLEPLLRGIRGVIFTGPAAGDTAALRNVTIFGDAQVERSASGTGTAAVMAVLDAIGLLDGDRPFVHESVIGTTFMGRVAGRTMVGDYPAIVAEISGSAWITGDHTFIVDDDDPCAEGFRI